MLKMHFLHVIQCIWKFVGYSRVARKKIGYLGGQNFLEGLNFFNPPSLFSSRPHQSIYESLYKISGKHSDATQQSMQFSLYIFFSVQCTFYTDCIKYIMYHTQLPTTTNTQHGKNVEFGNLIPRKFSFWREILAIFWENSSIRWIFLSFHTKNSKNL